MRSLRGFVTLLVAVIAALVLPSPASAVEMPTGVAPVAYSYVSHNNAAESSSAATERGPPAAYDRNPDYGADITPLVGASARPNGLTVAPDYDYDDLARLVQTTHGDHGLEEQVSSVAFVSGVVERSSVALKTVDDVLPGVKAGWPSRVAGNGKVTVWQAPGSAGNANMLRVMEPTERYPSGYVRFYNEHGQPIGLNGKPGPRPDTHIPRGPDGTYDLPEGW